MGDDLESIQTEESNGGLTISKKKIGLIVNPIAGMGGSVGLKGTDGKAILEQAKALRATPLSSYKATRALQILKDSLEEFDLVTYPHEMGEDEAKAVELESIVLGTIERGNTSEDDTKRAVRDLLDEGVDLLLFAGGDGTARDIASEINQNTPVIGIPAGVKIHSSVFAATPEKAGQLVLAFLKGKTELVEREVMDIDEEAFRHNQISARLFGYLTVPYLKHLLQPSKSQSSSGADETAIQREIADYVVRTMDDGYYFIGPGTTTRAIGDVLNIEKTLLGIDVIQNQRLVEKDANEETLLRYTNKGLVRIIVTPIGGQGFIFGRGNQQFSPNLLREVGKENIMIISTPAKLESIGIGEPLQVDTGDPEVDVWLRGYYRVIIGEKMEAVIRVDN